MRYNIELVIFYMLQMEVVVLNLRLKVIYTKNLLHYSD
jgi:hypothetical protein